MNLKTRIIKNVTVAILAVILFNLLILYLLKFPGMALLQIKKYWYLLVLLISGFGVQIGLYTYLRHKSAIGCGTSIASGGISGISMLLCCSHYLVNFLPFISLAFANLILSYTPYILLFGIASNLFGIWFMTSKLKNFDSVQKSNIRKISDINKIKKIRGKNG